MLFFFGTRASRIKQTQLTGNTSCPYCEQQNTFIATTFGRYFHIFWIPFIPISKTTILECSHCKKSYTENEVPASIKTSLQRDEELNPTKRPIWHGCGCLLIVAIIFIVIITSVMGYLFNKDEIDASLHDTRREYLERDINNTTAYPERAKDSIAILLKSCIDLSIEGIDTDEIRYLSRINDTKLLIILKVSDMKNIAASSRKELVYAAEECLEYIDTGEANEIYIAVDGNYNMLMVKTPYEKDLGGRFADESLLLPFYSSRAEETVIETTKEENSN